MIHAVTSKRLLFHGETSTYYDSYLLKLVHTWKMVQEVKKKSPIRFTLGQSHEVRRSLNCSRNLCANEYYYKNLPFVYRFVLTVIQTRVRIQSITRKTSRNCDFGVAAILQLQTETRGCKDRTCRECV